MVRQKKGLTTRDTPDFYNGFYSKITITDTSFTIEDNCGGIPMEVAEKYAFRMGRSAEKSDDELPTVGIYGIGMKRAIFKIGRSAVVTTRNDGCLYTGLRLKTIGTSRLKNYTMTMFFPLEGQALKLKISTMESLSFGTTLISLVCTLTSL